MSSSARVIQFAVSPLGANIDRQTVRWTGWSLVNFLFSRATGQPYNAPLLLTATGARTGKPRRVVLPFFPAGDAIAVVGSRGGMATDPYWARNLRKTPQATIHIRRNARRVHARVAQGEERADLWKAITAQAPVYLDYARRAAQHREIPVFILDQAR